MSKTIQVFTDGSYSSHRPDVCGLGVHFPNGEYKDISEIFVNKPTHQRAELMAIMKAIECVRRQNVDVPIEIFTDSKYAIGACTTWIHNWKRNGWKTTDKKDVQNKDIIEPLSNMLQGVTFHHVMAHTGETNIISKANAKADKLAKAAMKKKMN